MPSRAGGLCAVFLEYNSIHTVFAGHKLTCSAVQEHVNGYSPKIKSGAAHARCSSSVSQSQGSVRCDRTKLCPRHLEGALDQKAKGVCFAVNEMDCSAPGKICNASIAIFCDVLRLRQNAAQGSGPAVNREWDVQRLLPECPFHPSPPQRRYG